MEDIHLKITFEKDKSLTLIYIYLREFEGTLLDTIIDAKCELLISQDNSWIGINVYNENVDGEAIILPTIKDAVSNTNINLLQDDEKYTILFDSKLDIVEKKEYICNIDYNDDGFFGMELILGVFEYNTEQIKPYTTFRE